MDECFLRIRVRVLVGLLLIILLQFVLGLFLEPRLVIHSFPVECVLLSVVIRVLQEMELPFLVLFEPYPVLIVSSRDTWPVLDEILNAMPAVGRLALRRAAHEADVSRVLV